MGRSTSLLCCVNELDLFVRLNKSPFMVNLRGFTMGSPVEEVGRDDDEGPQHQVTVESFYMGRYELTFEEYNILREKDLDLPSDDQPDWNQNNVASLLVNYGQDSVTISIPENCTLYGVAGVSIEEIDDLTNAGEFPFGLFDFGLDCFANLGAGSAVTVTLHLPAGANPASAPTINTYYKFGPVPTNNVNHWYEFLTDGTTGATIVEDEITLNFIDGDRGDDDLDDTNGIIIDLGGPVYVNPASPASSSSWCFIDTLFSSFKKKQ